MLALDGTEWQVPLKQSSCPLPSGTSCGVVSVLKQVRCGCCRPWDADRVECPVFQADQAVEVAGWPQPRAAGAQPLPPSHCLSWIVPVLTRAASFTHPWSQVLSLCSVPLVSCLTLQVFVTRGWAGGKEGAASEVLEVTKQSSLQMNLLLLEKF